MTSETTEPKRGRPTVLVAQRHAKTAISLPPALLDLARREAEAQGTSLSDYVRRALIHFMGRE